MFPFTTAALIGSDAGRPLESIAVCFAFRSNSDSKRGLLQLQHGNRRVGRVRHRGGEQQIDAMEIRRIDQDQRDRAAIGRHRRLRDQAGIIGPVGGVRESATAGRRVRFVTKCDGDFAVYIDAGVIVVVPIGIADSVTDEDQRTGE